MCPGAGVCPRWCVQGGSCVWGGVQGGGVSGGGVHTPTPEIRSIGGRYASYWNAFLFSWALGSFSKISAIKATSMYSSRLNYLRGEVCLPHGIKI